MYAIRSYYGSLTAIFVQIPEVPAVPKIPRSIPLWLGPGPSPQNHSPSEPSEPVLSTSPFGRTHSDARRFSGVEPMEIVPGPNPTQPAVLASVELEQPTPGMFT